MMTEQKQKNEWMVKLGQRGGGWGQHYKVGDSMGKGSEAGRSSVHVKRTKGRLGKTPGMREYKKEVERWAQR